MCGRYALTLPPEALREFFEVLGEVVFPPRYNIAPTQPIHVVRIAGDGERRLELMRWGFVPAWVGDPAKFPLLINARIESAAEKPAFRNAVRRRRCLVPATGFYEWQPLGHGPKQPYLLRPAGVPCVAFAGVYETWIGPDGEEVDTAAILTRPANRALADIHDRMPVVVPQDRFAAWLDPRQEDGVAALEALPPAPDDLFERVPISTRVNAAANDGPAIQEPATVAVPDRADAAGIEPARPSPPNGDRRGAADDPATARQADGGQLDLF